MKSLPLFLASFVLLAACQTRTSAPTSLVICEVHKVPMTKRAVPYAHGMIPMSRVEAGKGEWHRRMTQYPHPGDCEPATDIVLPGQEKKAMVDVCPKCEAAMKEMQGKKP